MRRGNKNLVENRNKKFGRGVKTRQDRTGQKKIENEEERNEKVRRR